VGNIRCFGHINNSFKHSISDRISEVNKPFWGHECNIWFVWNFTSDIVFWKSIFLLPLPDNGISKGKVKVKWSRYVPLVAQSVCSGIALLFHDRGTRRRWVVSSTPRPQFTPGKDTVPTLQEARWVPGQVWTGGKSRPHSDSIPDRPARSQSLYRLSYSSHNGVSTNWFCQEIYFIYLYKYMLTCV